MPNWCLNTLEVTGPEDKVKAFAQKAKGNTSNYNSFHGESWEALDDIRIAAIASNMPEPGPISDLSFHALRPVPDIVCRLGFDDGFAEKTAKALGIEFPGYGGYRWQTSNWGTKWEPDVHSLEVDTNYIYYEFSTAWSPPLTLIEYLTVEWPELTFSISYREEGMGFEGEATYHNGLCLDKREGEAQYEEDEE